MCLLDHVYEASFANMKMDAKGGQKCLSFNIGERNKTIKLRLSSADQGGCYLQSTFSRILLQKNQTFLIQIG